MYPEYNYAWPTCFKGAKSVWANNIESDRANNLCEKKNNLCEKKKWKGKKNDSIVSQLLVGHGGMLNCHRRHGQWLVVNE